jgi:uncharacterized protein YjeT (DUF2065 family)
MAAYWVIVGIFLIVAPAKLKEMFKRLLKNLRAMGLIPLVVGILLVYSASFSKLPWFVNTVGLLALAKGFFFLLVPEKKSRAFLDWWLKGSLTIYRFWGLVALILGIFFFRSVA